MYDLPGLKSHQATVTFFPIQGLENNVAYWTSFGVAEAEPVSVLRCYEVALVLALFHGFPWIFRGFRECEQRTTSHITAMGWNLCVEFGEGLVLGWAETLRLNSKFSPQIKEQFHKTKLCAGSSDICV